jgi:hypothetical protein
MISRRYLTSGPPTWAGLYSGRLAKRIGWWSDPPVKRWKLTVLILFGTLFAMGADGDYVRFVLDEPSVTPYSTIRYEIIDRGRVTTAVHRRGLPGYSESLHGMGLLTPEEARELWAGVLTCEPTSLTDALSLSQAPEPHLGVTWAVDVRIGDVSQRFRVFEPNNQVDRRYARLFKIVRSMVEVRAGKHPFRNVFLEKRQRGWLNLVSVPAARVVIDGFDTGHETPLYGYEVERGKRKVTLISLDGTYERTYEIRIESGTTTRVRADIR